MSVKIPRFYEPRPAQQAAWARRLSGKYDYYFKIWHRQLGKDTDDIQYAMYDSWQNPGTQTAYVGLDNKWIYRNIWDKYLDGRKHWDNYPKDKIEVKDTKQQIKMLNNPEDKAPALIQFIGFKESESLIGASYERFFVSELSLYKRGAFDYIQPIWDSKAANGEQFLVNMNFTPRGLSNIAADMLRAYTKEDDPKDWPGEHGRVYVDVVPADKSINADGTRLYTDEHLEDIRQRYIRMHGNDNRFRQELMCDFLAVNAGLVYPAIEVLKEEGRYHPFNLNPEQPVYMAWDISSKDKLSDWTSAFIFQYYDGSLWLYDWFEDNRKAVVECIQELAKRDYFYRIRAAALPWDSDRSGSKDSPLAECMKMFQNINWHKLDRTYVQDGINKVRMLFPNMHINSDNCEWPVECFESWEYRELMSNDNQAKSDWTAEPKHDRFSHLMDAIRYVADMLEQVPYIKDNAGYQKRMVSHYPQGWEQDDEDSWDNLPPGMRPSKFSKLRKKKPSQVYGMETEQTDSGLWIPKG